MTISTTIQGSYTQVKTSDVAELVTNQLKLLGLESYHKIGNSREGGNKLNRWMLPEIEVNDGDSKLTGQVYLRNSDTPGTALTLMIGAFRFICANGLVVGIGEGGRVTHRTGPKIEDFVGNMEMMINRSLINLKDDLQYTIDENRAIPVADPIGIVASLPIQKTAKETLIYNIATGNVTENVKDVWGLYNFTNEVIRKHSRSADSALNKDIGLLDHIKLLNQYKVA